MTEKNILFPPLFRALFCCLSFFVLSQNISASKIGWAPPPPATYTLSVVLECGEDSLQLCTNLDNLGGQFSSSFSCLIPQNGSLTVENDTCFYYHPVPGFEGDDFTCIVVCDDANVCDTFNFEIFVESCTQQLPCVDIPYGLITIPVDDCGDVAKVCNPFPLGEALLYDYKINGTPYSGNLGICLFDTLYSYSYGSIPEGGLAGPYELEMWVVDNDTYGGTFNEVHELVDLMNMFDPNGNWQLDTTNFSIFTFNTASDYGQMTIKQTSTDDQVTLSKNSTTAPIGSSVYLPTGEFEVTLQHQVNAFCVDTFTAVVYCNQLKSNFDTITINQTKSLCADPLNLPGDMQTVESKCFGCQSIFVEQNGDCVKYTGIALGTDSLLMTACDQYGICDSTMQIVTVRSNSQLPIANIDIDTTSENAIFELDLLSNDQINGDLKNIFIIIYPQNGLVNIGTDFRITYQPNNDFCGMDAFAYEICNEHGCDTSTATIFVRCNSPLVYNGFSPNDDGRNDTFRIFNIEEYPQNHLRVYNRWGNLVYEKKDYQNEWDGRSQYSKDLPDGTYYYLFEIDNHEPVTGFVQINR